MTASVTPATRSSWHRPRRGSHLFILLAVSSSSTPAKSRQKYTPAPRPDLLADGGGGGGGGGDGDDDDGGGGGGDGINDGGDDDDDDDTVAVA